MNQSQAFDLLTLGSNTLLTGAAGSGKTYLINRFIRHCHEHSISLAITASTGIAATHIGGMTIHSWSGIGIRDTLSDDDIDDLISREYLVKRFIKTSVLIIDEISMLSGGFLANLDRLLRSARVSPEAFGGIQIILVGDFFQLPPVSRGPVEYAFEHPIWRNMELTPCVLTTQFRQSDDLGENALLTILSEIRQGSVSQESRQLLRDRDIPVMTIDHTELYTRNQPVDEYNIDRLLALPGEEYLYYMESRGAEKFADALKRGCLAPETLTLKKGARVMFVKNNLEEGYVNGLIGHIAGLHEGMPVVELLDGNQVIARPTEWSIEENGKIKASIEQIPLRLAWAITVHKSQGMTMDTAVINLLDAFVPGQGYVALSRVRTLEGLILRGFNEMSLTVDPRVIQFDRMIQAESDRVVEYLASFTDSELRTSQDAIIIKLGGAIEPKILAVGGAASASPKTATHMETYALIQLGKTLEEIAEIRQLKLTTIFTHFEKLIEEKRVIDLTSYRPSDEQRLHNIHEACIALSSLKLTEIRQYLYDTYGEEYSYDEIRMARLFLSEEDVLEIEAS